MHNFAVQLNADTNYKPIKYYLVAMDPNANLGVSDAVIMVRDYGWDTKANYDSYYQITHILLVDKALWDSLHMRV